MKLSLLGAVVVVTSLSQSSFAGQDPHQPSVTDQEIQKQIYQDQLNMCTFRPEDCPLSQLGAGNGGGNEPPLPTIKKKKRR